MPDYTAHITYDRLGTPGIWARDAVEAYYGLGYVHGLHRPLQTLLLTTAGQGVLAACIWPTKDIVRLDTLVHRLDVPGRAEAASKQLVPRDQERLEAFVAGVRAGLGAGRPQRVLRALGVSLAPPTVASVLGGLMLSSYLGLAESQDRMERAIVACLQSGADTDFLAQLHAPHLTGWNPQLLRRVKAPLGEAFAPAHTTSGGSNAWAVTGARTASGAPMLCGDPHLPINQLPAILLPVRVRLPHAYWLGASIPGLPGLAVGRNDTLAFSGTFSCADNADSVVSHIDEPGVHKRRVAHRRRGHKTHAFDVATNRFGIFDDAAYSGLQLCSAWCSGEDVAQAMGAYMQLPLATTVAEARAVLAEAHTLSLHYVLADTSGAIGQRQAGIVPQRVVGWSGLYPRDATGAGSGASTLWPGRYKGAKMPVTDAVDGIVVSANEAGVAEDGQVLANLSQPDYRRARIRALLMQRVGHDVASMGQIQLDVLSLQAVRLVPRFLAALPKGPIRAALLGWDFCYDAHSFGAHAFTLCYEAAVHALSPLLGGPTWRTLLQTTEVSVWWCRVLDRYLADAGHWQHGAKLASALRAALKDVATMAPEPWGRVQRVSAPHMLFGHGPIIGRGERPLVGSIATVCQGNLVPQGLGHVAVAPAFRMVCDLGEDALYCALPGGIDDRPLSASYTSWLDAYAEGRLHRLLPPSAEETPCMP